MRDAIKKMWEMEALMYKRAGRLGMVPFTDRRGHVVIWVFTRVAKGSRPTLLGRANTHSVDLVRAAHQGMKRAWREEFDPVMNPKRRHTSVIYEPGDNRG